MSARDLPEGVARTAAPIEADGLTPGYQADGPALAPIEVAQLLRREFGAILKIDGVLRRAIAEEDAAGIEVCSPHFEQMQWALNGAVAAVAAALGRLGKSGPVEGAQ